MDRNSVVRPRQERSRRTLRRMGLAVEELLAEKPFAEIGVAEVARRAGVTTGAFYARFAGKDALLDWFDEHYFEPSRRAIEREMDPEKWKDSSLRETLEGVIRLYVRFLRKHRHLLRPVVLENRAHPGSSTGARSRPVNLESYRRFVALLEERRAEIPRGDLEEAASFALTVLYATSHELILFPETGLHATSQAEERFISESTDLLYCYLTCGGRS